MAGRETGCSQTAPQTSVGSGAAADDVFEIGFGGWKKPFLRSSWSEAGPLHVAVSTSTLSSPTSTVEDEMRTRPEHVGDASRAGGACMCQCQERRGGARTTYVREVQSLKNVGASMVTAAEAEVALAMTEHLLTKLGATGEQLDRERARVRDEIASLMDGEPRPA